MDKSSDKQSDLTPTESNSKSEEDEELDPRVQVRSYFL